MQTATPMASPLGLVLLLAATYLVIRSPKKLQTLIRIVLAFVLTVILIMVPAAILRYGDPRALGGIAGLVGLLLAVMAGWRHTRALKRAAVTPPPQQPISKI